MYIDLYEDPKLDDDDFNNTSLQKPLQDSSVMLAPAESPGESTSPYARANMQLPQKRKRTWRQVIQDFVGRKQTVSGIPGENGSRIIHINNKQLNTEQKFLHNGVTTGKYSLITFLPKFLYEEFSKYANIFFLFVACIQVSALNKREKLCVC